MASKQIALGTILKTDHNTDATFESMTLVDQITPPARTREEIEGKALGDTLDVPLLGIEAPSRLEFTQYWHPGDSEHEKLDTLFGSKAEFDLQVVTPHSTPVTDEFSGQVVSLSPEQLTPSGAYKRQVVVLRTTAITRT